MMPMKKEVQEALSVLVGKLLWSCGNAAGLEWFSFGERRTVSGLRGEKEVGEYALHVQCAWRIISDECILVGGSDVHRPLGNDSRCPNLVVQGVEAYEAGHFVILLEKNSALEVFPDDSSEDEHWRLFKPYSDDPHLVFKGGGLQPG
jgi:hypothetical protein